jgi:predicted transcriptional regulator YheO
MNLKNYIQISNAITKLLDPMVEIVIHDPSKDSICFISGNLSKRKIGDPSLLDFDIKNLDQKNYQQLEKIIYPKLNFDGG